MDSFRVTCRPICRQRFSTTFSLTCSGQFNSKGSKGDDKGGTECSLNIVFFLKLMWYFWTLTVICCSAGVLPAICVHTLTPRGNRARPDSGIYFKIFEKTKYLMNTQYVMWNSKHNCKIMNIQRCSVGRLICLSVMISCQVIKGEAAKQSPLMAFLLTSSYIFSDVSLEM